MKEKIHSFILLILLLLPAACGPKKSEADAQIRAAVAATAAAIPTYTPYPIPTPFPTPTPLQLDGLFCEYQFCIGHPADVAFFDVSAQRNPAAPSTYGQGILAAYSTTLFIQLLWQDAAGASDPQFMLDLILDDAVDTRSGNLDIQAVGDLNVLYVPITSTASAVLPSGGAAAWTCGGRAFAWKTYTSQPDLAKILLDEAIRKFRCNIQ